MLPSLARLPVSRGELPDTAAVEALRISAKRVRPPTVDSNGANLFEGKEADLRVFQDRLEDVLALVLGVGQRVRGYSSLYTEGYNLTRGYFRANRNPYMYEYATALMRWIHRNRSVSEERREGAYEIVMRVMRYPAQNYASRHGEPLTNETVGPYGGYPLFDFTNRARLQAFLDWTDPRVKARATASWGRIRRGVYVYGRGMRAFRYIYEEVHYRPWHAGASEARADFVVREQKYRRIAKQAMVEQLVRIGGWVTPPRTHERNAA